MRGHSNFDITFCQVKTENLKVYLTLFIGGPQHTLDILDKACYNLLNSRISDNIMKQSKFWISIESQNVEEKGRVKVSAWPIFLVM